jgi:hypothetical protein
MASRSAARGAPQRLGLQPPLGVRGQREFGPLRVDVAAAQQVGLDRDQEACRVALACEGVPAFAIASRGVV